MREIRIRDKEALEADPTKPVEIKVPCNESSAAKHLPSTGHYVDTTGTAPDTNAADTDMAADNS